MNKLKKVVLSFILLPFLIVCGCENNNIVPEDKPEEDIPVNEDLQTDDTVNEDDISSIENQLTVIADQMSDSNFKYFTVADLDNNGRLEILSTSSYCLVSLKEIAEDYSSLQDKGTLEMLVNSEGEKLLKCYKRDNGYSYVGYDKYGSKLIYKKESDDVFNYSVMYEREFYDLLFYPDGDCGFLLPDNSDYDKKLLESKKMEDDYFDNSEKTDYLCLEWRDAYKKFDKNQLNEIYQSNTRKELYDMDELEYIQAFTGYNFVSPDKKGLSDELLSVFEAGAVFFPETDFTNGDVLISTDISNLNDFIFEMKCDGREVVHEYDSNKGVNTTLYKLPYDEWNYMLKEVYNEKDTNGVRSRLGTGFNGEMNAYYSASDNCIYLEHGTLGFSYDYAKVKNVEKTQDGYKISYCIYSGFSKGELIKIVDTYIVNDDNKYGYSLKRNERVY